MSTRRKSMIGLSGGICLVLVRLVQAGFYLASTPSAQLGGYLVAAALIIIATIFAAFLQETEPYKIFMQALLAPSFLVAVIAKADSPGTLTGVESDPAAKPSEIHRLTDIRWDFDLFATPAYAQTPPASMPVAQPFQIRAVDPDDFGDSFGDGVLSFLGRPRLKRDYALVLGMTTNSLKAQDYAREIEKLGGGSLIREDGVNLIRFEGKDEIFLLLGDFGTLQEVQALRNQVSDSAIKVLLGNSQDPQSKAAAALLAGGKVVSGKDLAIPPQ